MKKRIEVTVNGENYKLAIEAHKLLLEFLRDDLGLTGTKESCGMGECGACTVLLDGKAVNSCLILAVDADRKIITTIEGLAKEQNLDPLQESFIKMGAIQCGFCTSGMIMSAKALLNENPNPDISEIKKALAGNICRCSGYKKIIEAIKVVSSGEKD
ncbi:MAG: (2Fe-2S)-binding protein [Deltaproteobacteria bacterium]|nr:(2Fe-2S)-binding protein [Deltaproteobacteria bacterium]